MTDYRDPMIWAAHGTVRPRLIATPTAIGRMQAVVATNPTAAAWGKKIVGQADHLLTLPPLSPTWIHDWVEATTAPLSAPLQTTTSDDAAASPLDIARLFVLRIQTLGIVWFLTADVRYCERAKTELLAVCGFPDWIGDEFLVTAETTFGAAIGYDWLFDVLSEGERGIVADAVLTKGIEPGLDQFTADPPAHWTCERMNWNLVCNSALMIAALSIAEREPALTSQIFDECRQSVPLGFDKYKPDGGWAEGPGYWHYATQYAVYLVDGLSTALGDDQGLGASAGFGQTGLFRLHAAGPSGKLFNFGDSAEEHSGGYWLFWLGERYGHPVDVWIERQRGKPHPMDLLWFDPHARSPIEDHLPPHKSFRGIDVAMLRGTWSSADTTYLGIKGGANDSCPHAHYDLGNFVLDAKGVRWAIDLGPDDYSLPNYFKPDARATYYRTSTLGHNTLTINRQCQPPTASAPIASAHFDPDLALVVLDLTAAYPACERVLRGFALIEGRYVLIVDEVQPTTTALSLDWQLHTMATVQVQGSSATLTQSRPGAEETRVGLRIIEPAAATFGVASANPTGPAGQNPNKGVTKLVINLGAVIKPVRLGVLVSPDSTTPELASLLERPLDQWNVNGRL